MRPKERRTAGRTISSRRRLDQIVDRDHALAKLGRAIDWRFLEARSGAVYTDKVGHPPLPTRLMAGLAILSLCMVCPTRICARAGLTVRSPEPLRPGVLPAQADVRPLIADALAPANGGAAAVWRSGEPRGRHPHRRGEAGRFFQGDRRHHRQTEGGGLSDRRQAHASGARAAGKAGQENWPRSAPDPTRGWASMR